MNHARGILIAGNWKMNQTVAETVGFIENLADHSTGAIQPATFAPERLRACLAVPYLSLQTAQEAARRLPYPVTIAAQNAHWERKGAFTGEISGPMLREAGITTALVGHSERRQYFAETDATARKRAESLLEQDFDVIFCIGETRAEREAGRTADVLVRQIAEGLPANPAALSAHRLVVAYEPVWAIGTGLTATPAQAQEAHEIVRRELGRRLGEPVAARAQILYGGSVTPENVDSLLACPDVDGALVGGASVKPESFLALLRAGERALN